MVAGRDGSEDSHRPREAVSWIPANSAAQTCPFVMLGTGLFRRDLGAVEKWLLIDEQWTRLTDLFYTCAR
jgi:hypothetical protein